MEIKIRKLVGIVSSCVLAACVSLGSARFSLDRDTFQANYPRIKSITIEEAANNGFGTLTSEIKPSEFNDWKGQLFFQLQTANGTDQLFVEFGKEPGGVNVWVHGAGTRSNPNSAAKAIQARLGQLPKGSPSRTNPVAVSVPSRSLASSSVADGESAKVDQIGAPAVASKQTPKAESGGKFMTNIEIQKRLLALSYKAGVADGAMGKKTVEALKKFQADNQLTVTGVADDETVAKLAQKAPGTPARSASATPAIKGAASATAEKRPAADL